MTQVSDPIDSDAHVAAVVDTVAAEHWRLSAAITTLPTAELQAQLLVLRLCAGLRENYWHRVPPLVWHTYA